MNYKSKVKSFFCTLMLGAVVATCIPATQAEAFSTAGIRNWIKRHRILCFASIAIPIFGLYARKTIRNLFKSRTRQPQIATQVEERPENAKQAEGIDYFDKFSEAFTKTATLVGKIFKVARFVAADDDKWLDAGANL